VCPLDAFAVLRCVQQQPAITQLHDMEQAMHCRCLWSLELWIGTCTVAELQSTGKSPSFKSLFFDRTYVSEK
jgi:hypothetical protein